MDTKLNYIIINNNNISVESCNESLYIPLLDPI